MNGFLSTSDWGRSASAVRNDFHLALLWLRSLEIVIGHSPAQALFELNDHVFSSYRSPLKA